MHWLAVLCSRQVEWFDMSRTNWATKIETWARKTEEEESQSVIPQVCAKKESIDNTKQWKKKKKSNFFHVHGGDRNNGKNFQNF